MSSHSSSRTAKYTPALWRGYFKTVSEMRKSCPSMVSIFLLFPPLTSIARVSESNSVCCSFTRLTRQAITESAYSFLCDCMYVDHLCNELMWLPDMYVHTVRLSGNLTNARMWNACGMHVKCVRHACTHVFTGDAHLQTCHVLNIYSAARYRRLRLYT